MSAASKHRPRDWASHNQKVVSTAEEQMSHSQRLRQEAQQLTRHTAMHLQRTQREVQNQLSLRIDDIRSKREEVEVELSAVFDEIGLLLQTKDQTLAALRSLDLPLELARDCSKMREDRQGVDLVDDDVDAQLSEEAAMLLESKDVLQTKVDDCVEQLRLLRAANFQLEQDRKDKHVAHSIDDSCAALDETSRTVDYFKDAVRIHPSSVKPEDWDGFTGDNMARAEKERAASRQLRAEIDMLIKDINDRVAKKANDVENAFNTRIAEYSDTRNHIRLQLSKTQQEITAQEATIRELEDAIRARENPLKVATTRLDKRAQRPNVELVRDGAQDSLLVEVQEIEQAIETLQVKLDEAEEVHRGLVRAELALENDLQTKTNSLNIDKRAMLRRQQVKFAPTS